MANYVRMYVQKQKMLEITPNFRNNLYLLELASSGTNYSLQTADKAIIGCTKGALRYFGSILFFFFNFIVQKPKMLEITSNCKISLDFFELATFGTNYGLRTAYKVIIGCMKVALRYLAVFCFFYFYLILLFISQKCWK